MMTPAPRAAGTRRSDVNAALAEIEAAMTKTSTSDDQYKLRVSMARLAAFVYR